MSFAHKSRPLSSSSSSGTGSYSFAGPGSEVIDSVEEDRHTSCYLDYNCPSPRSRRRAVKVIAPQTTIFTRRRAIGVLIFLVAISVCRRPFIVNVTNNVIDLFKLVREEVGAYSMSVSCRFGDVVIARTLR